MLAAAEALRAFLAPLLPGYEWQFGAWVESAGGATTRFAVVRPAGGPRVELLRRPQLTLSLISADGGDLLQAAADADTAVKALARGGDGLVMAQPSEPIHIPTADRRHVFEIAVGAITNR